MVFNCEIEKEGGMFLAQFPDMPNVQTFGDTHERALEMAREALEGCLECDISRGRPIPPPAYTGGHPVSVASRIALSLRLCELRAGCWHEFGQLGGDFTFGGKCGMFEELEFEWDTEKERDSCIKKASNVK